MINLLAFLRTPTVFFTKHSLGNPAVMFNAFYDIDHIGNFYQYGNN